MEIYPSSHLAILRGRIAQQHRVVLESAHLLGPRSYDRFNILKEGRVELDEVDSTVGHARSLTDQPALAPRIVHLHLIGSLCAALAVLQAFDLNSAVVRVDLLLELLL